MTEVLIAKQKPYYLITIKKLYPKIILNTKSIYPHYYFYCYYFNHIKNLVNSIIVDISPLELVALYFRSYV